MESFCSFSVFSGLNKRRSYIRKMFKVKSTRRNTKRSGSPSHTDGVTPSVTPVDPLAKPTVTNTVDFFQAESAATSLAKPWLRLERGLRLQKFRVYAEAYPGLSPEEQKSLYAFLMKANDNKQLNTKQQVVYENGVIQSIRGLKVIRTGDIAVPAVFKIEATRLTKKHQDDS
jgi:hypothetical protein